MNGFFAELRRRNVYRVAVAYTVSGWLIAQVADTVFPIFALPENASSLVVVLLALGFPVALVFAWAFEVTPEGVRRTREVERDASTAALTGQRLNLITLGAVALLVASFALQSWLGVDHATAPAPTAEAGEAPTRAPLASGKTASIAVLPFVDLSPAGDQEYFSDGISEELLNLLAQLPSLQVTSRSSAFSYKGKDVQIRDVASELGVGHVLEGSVRKAGTRLRITAQLIDAATDTHLWSETYDRELDDVFAVQDEISAAIVAELGTLLALPESTTPEPPRATRTSDSAAYDTYLLGQHLLRARTADTIRAAVDQFLEAQRLDETFAPAFAGEALGWYLLRGGGSTYGDLTSDEVRDRAEPALARAFELDPDLPEAHAMRGNLESLAGRPVAALRSFERALELKPSYGDALNWYQITLDDLGRREEALAVLDRLYELDPLNPVVLYNHTMSHSAIAPYGRYEAAIARLTKLDARRGLLARVFQQEHRGEIAALFDAGLTAAATIEDDFLLIGVPAFMLMTTGLEDAARDLFPGPSVLLDRGSADPERLLAASRFILDENPEDPAAMTRVAFAHVVAGDLDNARRWSRRALTTAPQETVDGARLSIVPALLDFVADDAASARARTAGTRRIVEGVIDAGLGTPDDYLDQAILRAFAADREGALESLRRALAKPTGTISLMEIDTWFRTLGWDELPAFRAVREEHLARIRAGHRTLLERACARRYEVWAPTPETCGAFGLTLAEAG